MTAGRRLAAVMLAAVLFGCKPAAFSAHEADLLAGPPPALEEGQRARWNDLAAGSFGMIELAGGAYRYDGRLCKVAEATTIGPAGSGTQDFLYCQAGKRTWQVLPGITCRPAGPAQAISCRAGDADYFPIPRA